MKIVAPMEESKAGSRSSGSISSARTIDSGSAINIEALSLRDLLPRLFQKGGSKARPSPVLLRPPGLDRAALQPKRDVVH